MSHAESEHELAGVEAELVAREPIFHRPEFGTTRADFESMTEPSFWEVGASGRIYDRAYVLDVLDERQRNPPTEDWRTHGFRCTPLAPDTYLLTYTLELDGRTTRRSTIWRRHAAGWKIVYHQGTVVAAT